MPSIRTVAALAGVSTATVSNVLNGRRSVAADLVARVHAAVAELGYIADLGASRLRSRRSTVVGVLVPDIANPFFGTLVSVLEDAARRDGYDLLVVSSDDDPAQETARLRALLTWRPAGVIVVPCDDTLEGRDLARAASVPMVACDRIPAHADFDVVAVDNFAVSAEVGRHLVATGRRHILIAAARLAIGNVRERCEGLRSTAEPAGASVEIVEVGIRLADIRARLIRRLTTGPMPDALFTLNNVATLASLGALAEARLAVPEDVALVGFDESEWMRSVTPPLTTVRQPLGQMGRSAWARLMARIGGDDSPPVHVRLTCRLDTRASTAPARRLALAHWH